MKGFYVLAMDGAPLGPFVTQASADLAASIIAGGGLPPGLAFDKSSTRTESIDGHLRVEQNHISKACVSPYLGSEIPNHEKLGLDADKIYNMLRDPQELAKSAPTFRGVPLLIKHIPVNSADHPHDKVVGTIGTEVEWVDPYLDAPLVIWTDEGKEGVFDQSQYELSPGYHYDPDMRPGTWNGQAYDGVMRGIVGNHVALVEKGRHGSDVVVGDADLPKPYKETAMAKVKATVKLPSRTALRLGSAISVALSPLVAQDKQLDLTKLLAATDAKTFKAKKKDLAKMALDAAMPALTEAAQGAVGKGGGAGPDDVIMRVLDMVDGQIDAAPPGEIEADQMQPNAAAPAAAAAGGGDDPNNPQPKKSKLAELLGGKGMSEDDISEIEKAMDEGGNPQMNMDDELDEDGKPKKKEPAMDKKAMDAAIGVAVEAERARNTQAQEARHHVRPLVGDVAVTCDTAEKVHRAALDLLGVKHAGLHPDSLRPIIDAQPKPDAVPPGKRKEIAMDGAGMTQLAEAFPHMMDIRVNR